MILFDIIQDNEERAIAMSNYLIKNNFAVQTHIDTNSIVSANGHKQTVRLFFITKALLYTIIEKEIKEHFSCPEMIIYATPISQINEEFGELLRTQIKAI
jgi:hypothetical protein